MLQASGAMLVRNGMEDGRKGRGIGKEGKGVRIRMLWAGESKMSPVRSSITAMLV